MHTLTKTITREISLEPVHNIRHLGGYSASGGRKTSAQLVRSASLRRLTHPGLEALAAYGIRTVVDLRSPREQEEFATPPLAPFGIERVSAPVFANDASPVALGQEFPGFATVYRTFLETGRDAYLTLVETIVTREGGVLVHCAAGKDRTGVAVMLLLELAGVADIDILYDHSLSAAFLSPMLLQWQETMKERGIDPSRANVMIKSEPEDIADTLAHLRARWGGAEGYFRDLGLDTVSLTTLQARLLA